MNLLQADTRLCALGVPAFTTADAGACWGVTKAQASLMLHRLEKSLRVHHLARGRWTLADGVDVLSLPEHLTSPFPAYVSLQTALYHHGMISQIPAVVYAVSIGRTSRYCTPLGSFSIHHIAPSFFFGFTVHPKSSVKLAEPEKALLDVLYLGPGRSGLFKTLPEIEFPRTFRRHKAEKMITQIRSVKRRSLVARRFEELFRRERKGDSHRP